MLNGMVGRGCFSSPLKEGEQAMWLSAGGVFQAKETPNRKALNWPDVSQEPRGGWWLAWSEQE